MKKAQMSTWIIVLAVLALIALVVMGFVMTDKVGFFNKNTATCASFGGSCSTHPEGLCSGESTVMTSDCPYKPENENRRLGQCCVP